ncbi:MAG TPA: AAA family ATPase [Verrucomicrobiae bacterium]|nr:AAA family ATPase [Verrucomicrobiae bacterium]
MTATIHPVQSHTLTLPWVTKVTQGFVYCDEMREAVSLALVAGVNLIFSGDGGHAKSEFLDAVFRSIKGQETYIKSFGQGTSAEDLFGGLDLDAINRAVGATMQYKHEFSFLNHYIAIFEELFDAPPRVLAYLKDTLTAKELRNGHQRVKMKTRVIAAATNHSPQEIAEAGRDIEALIQRFPIQLEVKWPAYGKDNFMELFAAVFGREEVESGVTWSDVETLQRQAKATKVSVGIQRMTAQIVEELIRDKARISPRTAVVAVQLAQAAATINGRNRVVPADLKAMAYLPGIFHLRKRINQLINEFAASIEAEEKLDQAELDLTNLVTKFKRATDGAELQRISTEANRIAERIHAVAVPETLLDRRRHLYDSAHSLVGEAGDNQTRIELNKLEADLLELQYKLGDGKSIPEYEQISSEARAILEDASNLPTYGMHTEAQAERIVSDAQSLLWLAEEELQKARQKASTDENSRRLKELAPQVEKIGKRLSRSISEAEKRQLLGELVVIRLEISHMLRHPSLNASQDAILSKIMVIQRNNR